MMKNYKRSVEINHSRNLQYIPDHLYRILIFGAIRSGKFIYTSQTYSNQSINYLLMNKKK